MSTTALPCRYCLGRPLTALGESREDARRHHEETCAYGVDCDYCRANIGKRCTTRAGGPSPAHVDRRP